MAKEHLTFEEICALPLLQQAVHHENARHRARVAEIQAMAKALAALELERAEIERNGYRLFGESIARDFAGSALRYSGHMGFDEVRLVKALLRSGWKLTERGEAPYPSPTFRKGRVNFRLSCLRQGSLEMAEQELSEARAEAPAC